MLCACCVHAVPFLPLQAGWWHVVLNVRPSTAISHSLALHRDLDAVFPPLNEADPEFAEYWLSKMELAPERNAELMRMSAGGEATAAGDGERKGAREKGGPRERERGGEREESDGPCGTVATDPLSPPQ